jgi:hypothetical protein
LPDALERARGTRLQIAFLVGATPDQRDDVLDLEARHHEVLRSETIPAALARCHAHSVIDGGRDSATGHRG